jgi:hypothetical protein
MRALHTASVVHTSYNSGATPHGDQVSRGHLQIESPLCCHGNHDGHLPNSTIHPSGAQGPQLEPSHAVRV